MKTGFSGFDGCFTCITGEVYPEDDYEVALLRRSARSRQVANIVLDALCDAPYNNCTIRSFKSKETDEIFARTHSRKFPQDIQQAAYRKLRTLNNAVNLNDLGVFSYQWGKPCEGSQ